MSERSPSFLQQRQELLLQLLRTEGSIVVSEAAARLKVSEPTIRRDVNALAKRGLVARVHGGATLLGTRSPFGRDASEPRRQGASRGGSGARFTFGMVVPSFSYYWPSIIAGARAAASDTRAELILRGSSGSPADDRKQIRILAETPGVHGLIVAPVMDVAQSVDLLNWVQELPMPVVMAERRAPGTMPPGRLEWAVSDHAAGAAMAVQHLYAQGHRRVGLFASAGSPTTKHVQRGWRDQLRACGLDPDQQVTGPANAFTEDGRDALLDDVLAQCSASSTRALLVHPDPPALALVQHCLDVGVRVPDELAVVAYDDEVAHLGQPAVTAVRPPKQHVGRLAVELLVARLNEGPRRPAHRVMISPELVVRNSSSVGVAAGNRPPAERAAGFVLSQARVQPPQ
ncbi:DNA-binding transcriptional regulator, LacI/PurR family [Actinopolymorpha cephalotaxi]|uniref:DNA-binding transcriptional regulator, LacI/PurR family n=1 Tax=Actinopolymorpha cephalotaxi TaxID=504797 RepID=A0A1I3CBF0_9ACTN|nr:substrate-binding domain-containing protein [Actinopolymorpha cephalotaxi]SFH71884.1 DNA-binding transcriptional regulator, LacI/PurR family [Actinopolymorpha cephalotaxi]